MILISNVVKTGILILRILCCFLVKLGRWKAGFNHVFLSSVLAATVAMAKSSTLMIKSGLRSVAYPRGAMVALTQALTFSRWFSLLLRANSVVQTAPASASGSDSRSCLIMQMRRMICILTRRAHIYHPYVLSLSIRELL